MILCLEGLLFAGSIWSGKQNRVAESQLATVRRIEDKQSLINKLDQVAQSELADRDVERAEPDPSQGNLFYRGRHRGTKPRHGEGIASTISELNTYINHFATLENLN